MKKRLLFLVPAVAMLLAGCGKNGGDPTSTSGVTPTTEQPSTSGEQPTSQSGTPTEPGPDSSSSVEPAPDVEPAEIYLSPSNRANLIVGDTMQFTAEVRNQAHSAEGVDQRVTWEIAAADEGKYTCVDGLVTAVAPGQDMILTVKSVAKDTVTKTITININKADRALPSETSDGFSLLTSANLNSFENGSEVYFAGVVEDDVWMAKAQSGNNVPAEKAEVNEGGKLVPSANAAKWVVSFNADETVTFTRNSKVLYTPNTGNHLKEAATSAEGVEEAMYHFELTDLDAQGNAVAKSKYVSDKGADQTANIVRFNNTNKYDGQLSPIFSAYKPTSSVTHKFAMYFKAPVVLNRIEVKTEPTNTDYFVGDEFSSVGLEVEAVYSDLHRETLNASDYELSIAEGKALVAGDSGEVTVTLKSDNSKTCTFDITVAEIVLQSLEVSTPTKHEYVKGATFDPSTITVTAHYNDSRVDKVIPFKVGEEDGYTVLFDTSAAGTDKTATVSYGGESVVLEGFTVLDIEVVKIELISGPSSSLYYESQQFDRSRIGVKATFNNETVDEEFDEYRIFPNRALTTSDLFVFIYFGEESLVEPTEGDLCFKLAVTVEEDAVASIAIDEIPGSTQFSVGETFSLTRLGQAKVNVTYLSGKVVEDVLAENAQIKVGEEWLDSYTFTSYTDEKYDARLVYAEKTAAFQVDMQDSVASVVVKEGSTHKVAFKSGETFSRENLVLHGVWYSGFEDDITSGFVTDLDGHVFTDTDVANSPLTVTVTYGNSVTCNYDIAVSWAGMVEPGDYYIKAYAGDGSDTSNIRYLKASDGDVAPAAVANIGEASLVHFELISSNKYEISIGTKYLCLKDTNNGVRVLDKGEDGYTYEWGITTGSRGTEGGYDIFAAISETVNRYLTLYNNQDWRSYNSATATNRKVDTLLDKNIGVESVSLDQNEVEMTLGGSTMTLSETVLPANASNKNVTWSSNHTDVVTVSNGVLTAIGPGTAIITVTTVDGSKTDTCDVTVVRPSLSSIVLTPDTGSYNVGDVITISAAPNPSEAELPADLTYEIVSGSELVSQNNNEFTVAGAGTLQVRATSATLPLVSSNVCEFTLVNITKELVSIAVDTSSAKTEFTVGDTPTYDGLVVTATYNVGELEPVELSDPDLSVSFPGGCMNEPGTPTVTVGYTYEGVTKTTTYQITVKANLKTYTHGFTAKPSGDVDLSGITWTASSNFGSYNSSNYAGVQVGTSSATATCTIETKQNWGSVSGDYYGMTVIKNVYVWVNTGGSLSASNVVVEINGVSASVSGTVVKNSSASSYEDCSMLTFTPASGGTTGKIKISITNDSKAAYLCGIRVVCSNN